MGDARNDNDEDDDDDAGLVFIYGDDDDKDDDDGGADLVFMAVCRPTHGSTIFSFTHFKATEGEGTRGPWGGARMLQDGEKGTSFFLHCDVLFGSQVLR